MCTVLCPVRIPCPSTKNLEQRLEPLPLVEYRPAAGNVCFESYDGDFGAPPWCMFQGTPVPYRTLSFFVRVWVLAAWTHTVLYSTGTMVLFFLARCLRDGSLIGHRVLSCQAFLRFYASFLDFLNESLEIVKL